MDVSDLDLKIPSQIEEARLYWSRSEENIAKHLMRNLIDRLRKVVFIYFELGSVNVHYLALRAPRKNASKKLRLLKLSAANNCLTLLMNLSIEAIRVDPDQTAPRSSLIWVYTVIETS